MAFDKDRREAERFPVSANVACTFAAPIAEDIGPVKIKNISLTGIGFITSKKLESNARLLVKIENAAKKFTKTVLVHIVHITPQAGGIYLVGATLDVPLTYEELCNFVM